MLQHLQDFHCFIQMFYRFVFPLYSAQMMVQSLSATVSEVRRDTQQISEMRVICQIWFSFSKRAKSLKRFAMCCQGSSM